MQKILFNNKMKDSNLKKNSIFIHLDLNLRKNYKNKKSIDIDKITVWVLRQAKINII
jgi:hypothetical protein